MRSLLRQGLRYAPNHGHRGSDGAAEGVCVVAFQSSVDSESLIECLSAGFRSVQQETHPQQDCLRTHGRRPSAGHPQAQYAVSNLREYERLDDETTLA